MKWYYNIAQSIIEALQQIFNEEKQADKVVNHLLKSQKKWGARDRRFVAQVLYDIVRWKRYYEAIAEANIENQEDKWKILAVWSYLHQVDLPDWAEFQSIDLSSFDANSAKIADEAILNSIPDWLQAKGASQLGAELWKKEITALNKEAEVVIRVNTLKTTRYKLQQKLSEKGIETYRNVNFPNALFLSKRKKITHLPCYKKGLFEVQDASSQLVAPFSGAQSGMTVIDSCAGAGGKTLHLAAQMQNQGQIFAYDIYQHKIDELNTRAKRNNVSILRETAVINQELIKRNANLADILLIDAPCSSLGTLRRKPDLKWKLNPEKLRQIKVIQQDILNTYTSMLKPGGSLIYVTCSILPEENQEIVKDFLDKHNNYTFVDEKTIYPSALSGDGFYMAKLIKQH